MTDPTPADPATREDTAPDGPGTEIGTTGGSARWSVGPDGSARPAPPWSGTGGAGGAEGWRVSWWIQAEDRWYRPDREPTVRQRRAGPGPVVETALSVKGGDVRALVYAARGDGADAAVIEVENLTSVPLAVAFVVSPAGPDPAPAGGSERRRSGPLARLTRGRRRSGPMVDSAAPGAGRVRLDGAAVWAGDRPVLVLPRPPLQAVTTNRDPDALLAAELDPTGAGTGGEGLRVPDPSATGRHLVAVAPVPHKTSFRVAMPVADDPGAAPGVVAEAMAPARVADPEAVQRGWSAVVDAGVRFTLPDPGLTDLAGAAVARLLLAADQLPGALADLAPGAGAVLEGLAVAGRDREVAAALPPLTERFPTRLAHGPSPAAEVLVGLAAAHRLLGPPGVDVLELALAVTGLVDRSGSEADHRTARRALADLAAMSGDLVGAADLRSRLPAGGPAADGPVACLSARAAVAGGTLTFGPGDDPGAAGRFLAAVRDVMIGDHGAGADGESGPDGPAELRLLPEFPTHWRGGPLEVHGLATDVGIVSFAIRWHGYRPALLWELEPPVVTTVGEARPVVLRCPGLDPDWSSTEPRGETLLAGTAEGLTPTPSPGQSFS
ncbi:MAG: hypothetical protein ACK5PP_01700 [Acidimicrobiales bacterium]